MGCSEELNKLDGQLKDLYNDMGGLNNNWYFVGDHGMTSVKENINILQIFEDEIGREYKLGSDYFIFIDSTIFRFWSNNKNEATNKQCLEKAQYILSSMCSVVGTPDYFGFGNDRIYGDLIAILESGKVFFPDYFNDSNKEIRGMHGYMPDNDLSTRGMAIISSSDTSNEKINEGSLTDIYLELKSRIL